MTWADHAFAATLVVLLPAPVWSVSRLARRIESGDARARLRFYGWGIAEVSTQTLLLVMLWHWTGRPFAALGIVAPAGTAAWVTVALCVATAIFYAVQIRTVLESEEAQASLRAQIESSPPAPPRCVSSPGSVSPPAFARSGCTEASSCGT
jgi:hypothetical protein